MKRSLVTLSTILLATACSTSNSQKGPDASNLLIDAPNNRDAAMATLPTWQLEDVQPESPNFGQTHGLASYAGRVVVVTLLEGF